MKRPKFANGWMIDQDKWAIAIQCPKCSYDFPVGNLVWEHLPCPECNELTKREDWLVLGVA